MSNSLCNEKVTGIITLIPSFHSQMSAKRNDDSLNARGQTGFYKPCLMITGTGVCHHCQASYHCRNAQEEPESEAGSADSV